MAIGGYPSEYTTDLSDSEHSPMRNSGRKRSYSNTSSDFQFCPSEEEDQQDWEAPEVKVSEEYLLSPGTSSVHVSANDSAREGFCDSTFKASSFPSITSAPNLPTLQRSYTSSNPIRSGVFSCRKKVRRSYSLGEVDNTSYDTDVNFENILGNWNNVRNFFTDKCPADSDCGLASGGADEEKGEEEGGSTPPFSPSLSSPYGSFSEEDKEDTLCCIEVDDDTTAPLINSCSSPLHSEEASDSDDSSITFLLRFCLEKDPWQRSSRLCADIQRLLATNSTLVSEMTAYSEALAPPPQQQEEELSENSTEITDIDSDSESEEFVFSSHSPFTPRLCRLVQRNPPRLSPRSKASSPDPLSGRKPVPTLTMPPSPMKTKTSCEIATVRTFLAFSLACLHSAAAKDEGGGERHASLLDCAEKWGEYAQCCL